MLKGYNKSEKRMRNKNVFDGLITRENSKILQNLSFYSPYAGVSRKQGGD